MLLSDRDIVAEIDAGRVALEPYDRELVQPSSIDVRLDRFFRVFNNSRYTHIDPSIQQDELTTLVEPRGEEAFVLHPGEFVLGSTLEVVTLPDDVASRLEGKSSLGRLGLITHSTAGFIDPGFSGHITLELSNVANLPIMLWPGMKIGQLCLIRLSSPAEFPYGSSVYGSRYQGQRGPTASRSYQNFSRAQTGLTIPTGDPSGGACTHLGWGEAVNGFLVVVFVVVVVIAALTVFQRQLIYLSGNEAVPPIAEVLPRGTEWTLETDDGLELTAWFVEASAARADGMTVLVAPGNAGNRSHRVPLADALTDAGFDVLLVDYRGYGGNPGSPSEAGLALDIRAAYEAVLDAGVPAERLLLFGESLGGAVVTGLATQMPAAGLMLRSPFVDLASVASDAYPFLPVRWLLKDRLPVLEPIRDVWIPVAVVYGTADSIVDPAQSRRVADAAPNRVATIAVDGADHNDAALGYGPQVVSAVEAVADA